MKCTETTSDYALARSILGADFISPEEVANSLKSIVYTDEQLTRFGDTLPTQDILEWCRDNNMMLVASPPTALTVLDVRAIHSDVYDSEGGPCGWYISPTEKFACADRIEALAWIAFRKEPVEDSLNKTWTEQQALVLDPLRVPNAAEVTWALTVYKDVRDIYLLEELYVRTSSVGSGGEHYVVGCFGSEEDDELCLNDYWPNTNYKFIGLAAVRKF